MRFNLNEILYRGNVMKMTVTWLAIGLSTALAAHDEQSDRETEQVRQVVVQQHEQALEQAELARRHANEVREQAHEQRQMQRVQLNAQARQAHELKVQQRHVEREQHVRERVQERVREEEQQSARREYEKAQEALHEAARKVGKLSADLTPGRSYAFKFLTDANRAMLGVSISNLDLDDEQIGVQLNSVSPGGPAEKAGLQSKDVLLAINDVRLDDHDLDNPSDTVLEVMSGLEPGDEVHLEFLRDGVIDDAVVVAERRTPSSFAPVAPLANLLGPAHGSPGHNVFFQSFGGFDAGLELVNLNPDLGEYFGTTEGLLVVDVPDDFPGHIKSGDVLLSIDGREPKDPQHAFHIMRSYEQGERVALSVLRSGDELGIEFEVPEPKHMNEFNMVGGEHISKILNGFDFDFDMDSGVDGNVEIRIIKDGQEFKIDDLESLKELNILEGVEGFEKLKEMGLLSELPETLSKSFDALMEEGFVNGLHFEFITDDGAVDLDQDVEVIEWVEEGEAESII